MVYGINGGQGSHAALVVSLARNNGSAVCIATNRYPNDPALKRIDIDRQYHERQQADSSIELKDPQQKLNATQPLDGALAPMAHWSVLHGSM